MNADAMHRAMRSGLDFLVARQGADGSWRGEYGGPMFLLPIYVAACHIARVRIPDERRQGMIAYLRHCQNPDGSIGLHELDSGCMFTTALSYAGLRILGLPADDDAVARMRAWIHRNGGVLGAASWGKMILAVLNLYPYEGLHPILPELWLLPYALPVHPGRLWCHSRQVYLPMAWLYGSKAQMPEDELVRALRAELYVEPYRAIDFSRHRDTVAACDNRYPATWLLKTANRLMGSFESRCPSAWRRRALAEVYQHIRFEDRVTQHIDIGPVNSVLNALVHHFVRPGGQEAQKSFAALQAYLCATEDGIKFNGYNNTALWDTAFAVQSILSTPFAERYADSLRGAFGYIRDNQVLEDVPDNERYYRHWSKGGWPFSDRAHGWPITDCTAEGFKAAVGLERLVDEPLDAERLEQSVRLILSFQNRDGGWATYEKKRAGAWLEWLNPSQVFSDIMVDHSYVECSSACIQALVRARGRFGARLDERIDRAVRRGVRFIRKKQRPDGSWEGSWAVCFTYGTWFAVSGLLAGGVSPEDQAVRRACGFLIQRQNKDGGWGEHHTSCVKRRYVRADQSWAANTAWALMTLVRAGLADTSAARRAAAQLIDRQQPDGDWPREPLVGVFSKSTLIDYDNYRRYFPIWALAELDRASNGGRFAAV